MTNHHWIRWSFGVVTFFLLSATHAHSSILVQPTMAAAQLPMTDINGAFVADNLRNQAGLSAGYSQGDDFEAYILTNPTHANGSNISWASGGTPTGNLDFDLGGSFELVSMAVWNHGGLHPVSLDGFTLLADDNSAFSSPTILGSFTATLNSPVAATLAEVFSFTPTTAAFVRMQITSNLGGSWTQFGEVAFGAATPEPNAIPEPTTFIVWSLLGLTATGSCWWRRTRTTA